MIRWNSHILFALITAAVFLTIAACSLVDNWSLTSSGQPDAQPVVRFEVAGHLTEPPPPEPNPTTLKPEATTEAPLPEFDFTLNSAINQTTTTLIQGEH